MQFACFDPRGRRVTVITCRAGADAALLTAHVMLGRGAMVAPADAEAAAEQWRHERRARRYDLFTREEMAGPQ